MPRAQLGCKLPEQVHALGFASRPLTRDTLHKALERCVSNVKGKNILPINKIELISGLIQFPKNI